MQQKLILIVNPTHTHCEMTSQQQELYKYYNVLDYSYMVYYGGYGIHYQLSTETPMQQPNNTYILHNAYYVRFYFQSIHTTLFD